MSKLDVAGMYFESRSTNTKKHFKFSFPYDVLFSLRWDKKEQKLLQKYDKSPLISSQLKMLAMIAEKMEKRGGEQFNKENTSE